MTENPGTDAHGVIYECCLFPMTDWSQDFWLQLGVDQKDAYNGRSRMQYRVARYPDEGKHVDYWDVCCDLVDDLHA